MMSVEKNDLVSHHLEEMLADGTITPFDFPYADSVISSQKEKPKFTILCWRFWNPSWIFCFTTIDLISGYQWVTEEKSAYICPFGLFQFEVIPFKTCCIPESNGAGCDRPPR